jgi:hypothetical protein
MAIKVRDGADPQEPPIVGLLKSKIKEIRTSRKAALKDSSHTAVATLHKLECDVLARVADLSKPTKPADPFEDLTDNEQAGMLVSMIMSLPPDVQKAVRDALVPPVPPGPRLIGGGP